LLKQGRSARVALLAQWLHTLPAHELLVVHDACTVLETFTQSHRQSSVTG
jgi:hypothetical protein